MPEESRRWRVGVSSGTVLIAEGSRGLRELTEAKEFRRTFASACFDARLSWCLSRRLRNRDMPFIVVVAAEHPSGEDRGCGLEGFAGQAARLGSEEGADDAQARWMAVGKRIGCLGDVEGLPAKRGDDVHQEDMRRVKGPQRETFAISCLGSGSAASRELESQQAGADGWDSPIGYVAADPRRV